MMKTPPVKPDYSTIRTLKDLRAESSRLKSEIRLQERELREQLKSLPVETIKAGTNRLFSGKILSGLGGLGGPVAGMAASALTAFLGTWLTKKSTAAAAGKTGTSLLKTVLVTLAPVILNKFFGKKKKTVSTASTGSAG